jgi:hypothetical protein
MALAMRQDRDPVVRVETLILKGVEVESSTFHGDSPPFTYRRRLRVQLLLELVERAVQVLVGGGWRRSHQSKKWVPRSGFSDLGAYSSQLASTDQRARPALKLEAPNWLIL